MNVNSVGALRDLLLRGLRRRAVQMAAAAVVVYALLGFLLLPYLVERAIPRFAHDSLQREASIGAVRFNPFLFRLEADEFRLQEADGQPLAGFRHLLIDFELSSLFRWAWTCADIQLDGLDLLIDRDPEGRNNLALLVASVVGEPAAPEPKPAAATRLLLQRIALSDGVITYRDRAGAEPAEYVLQPVALELENVATLPEHNGAYVLRADLPQGGSVRVQGDVTLQPLAAHGELGIKGFRLAAPWAFLRERVRLAEPEGTVEFQTGYRFILGDGGPQLELERIQLQIAGLDVREPQAAVPLLALQTVEIRDGRFDLGGHKAELPRIVARNGRVSVALAEDGAVNWLRLLATDDKPVVEPLRSGGSSPGVPWHLQVGAAQLDGIALSLSDRSRSVPVQLEVGSLGATLGADISIADDTTVVVDSIGLQLHELKLVPIGATEPLAVLGEFGLENGSVDTGKQEVAIDRIRLHAGLTRIDRDADGKIKLLAALAPGAVRAGSPKAPAKDAAGADWHFRLDTLQLDDYGVGVSDQSLQPSLAYDLQGISATVKGVSNAAQAAASFEARLRVAQGGTLTAAGSFVADGSAARARLELDQLALVPLQPLLAQRARLDLKAGSASARIDLNYAPGASAPLLRAAGTARIDGLRIDEAIDGDRLVAWKTLTADGIDYTSEPGKLVIRELHLTAPDARVEIFKDRSVNLGKAFEPGDVHADKPKPTAAAAQRPAAQRPAEQRPFPVSITRVRVEKGIVDYSDQSLVLPFAAKIHDFKGVVTGISSDPAGRARLDFEGRVEDYGSARINGTLALFAPKRFTDIRTRFSNVDMPPLSPYSGTFAGRRIASGKLSLDLQYKIEDGRLEGDNKILLEQFTLGEQIESADALDLPLDLAVALLTDSQGRIDIAVPVTGEMDNPQFSLGGVIGQALVRMLTRIITAPFAALANLLGGSAEQASVIAFDPGSFALAPPQQEKLVGVGKALAERPQMKVIVGGRYDPRADGLAMRDVGVRRELAAELEVKLAADEDPGPVAFDDARTQRALEKLLKARAGDQAVDEFQAEYQRETGETVKRVNPLLAMVGQASPGFAFYEALFKHLVEIHPLADADLQALAEQRAAAMAQSLITDAGVDAPRVEIGQVEPAGKSGQDQVESALSLGVR